MRRIVAAFFVVFGTIFYILLFKSLYLIPELPKDEPVLIFENKVFEGEPFIIEDGNILVSYNILKENLDPYLFWDPEEKNVTITTFDKTVRLKTDSLTAIVNTKPVEISFPVKVLKQPYLPIKLLEDLYNIDIRMIDKNRVIIDRKLPERKMARPIGREVFIKLYASWFSPNVAKVGAQESLALFDYDRGWYQVRTGDGIIGFVSEKNLEVFEMENKEKAPDRNVPAPVRGKLNMVWDYIHSAAFNIRREKAPKGLDIISPTWFSIIDGKGTIESKADISYIQWAHNNDLAVWALIDNNFDPETTHEFLNSSEARENIIRQILMYAELFHLDGINIDFENINLDDKRLLVQFMRELAPVMHEAGITVSQDITVKSQSSNWSLCYDRAELGKTVDYLILMAYDEHWAASPKSGSVASIGWVEQGIKTLLEDVPPQKVILGLPFYTREWEERPGPEGTSVVKSKTLSMAQAQQTLAKNKARMSWDETCGQNFAYYTKGDAVYKIWLEDEKSIELKASLVKKYNLAGAAAWRKGFEVPAVWDVIFDVLKAPVRM
ncbi:MAG: glycosyl hydrolase family 18 protein [Tepidanaerobacteraceae bacterium]|jgi:spore germination protein YaaH|nr:glycosyl hydrolase family 18 protein [Tepidanaerobacteraceae bacterium]